MALVSEGFRFTQPGLGQVSFRFSVGASATFLAPLTAPGGCVTSCEYAATGKYTVTLAAGFRPEKLISAKATIGGPVATVTNGKYQALVDVAAYSDGVFTIQITHPTAGDDSAHAAVVPVENMVISVDLVGQFDSVLGG